MKKMALLIHNLLLRNKLWRTVPILLLMCLPSVAFAGPSITLSGATCWTIGTQSANYSITSSTPWIVSNASDGTEDICANVADNQSTWTSGASAGNNTFVLKTNSVSGTLIPTGTCNTIKSTLAQNETYAFNLYFQTPTAGDQVAHTMTVTLTATNWTFICGTSTVADVEGNIYNTTSIGTQCWMATNMRTTKYPDGTNITRGPTGATWDGSDHGYYAYPPNTGNTAEETLSLIISGNLGFVYQWSAAMHGSASCNGTGSSYPPCSPVVQGICPSGWHIPSHYEFTLLEKSCGGSNPNAFPYDTTTTGWLGTNEGTRLKTCGSGYLCGLLAGYRGTNGAFFDRASVAGFWSWLESGTNAWGRYLYSTNAAVYRGSNDKAYGFSVRCLKD